jgi:hypothetical protein
MVFGGYYKGYRPAGAGNLPNFFPAEIETRNGIKPETTAVRAAQGDGRFGSDEQRQNLLLRKAIR